MEQTTYDELKDTLKTSELEITKLREELNFYRNIISPLDKKGGLRIQSLSIEPGLDKHAYRYKLILVQALKHDRTISGRAKFTVSGQRDGVEEVLEFPDKNDKPIRVRFKYFQDIEGIIELPPDFSPSTIQVSVAPSGRRRGKVEQTYPWPSN